MREYERVTAHTPADDAVPFMLEGVEAVASAPAALGVTLADLNLDDIVFD